MKVRNEIKEIIEGKLPDNALIVESDWHYDDRVWVEIGSWRICVSADELKRAIDNACNHKQ